jgi:hypothetical protein
MLCHGVLCIFLTTPLPYAAVAFYFGQYEKPLHYENSQPVIGQIAVEPIATRPSFIDKDEVRAFGLQPTDQFIDIALARTNVPKRDDLGVRFLGDVSDGNGLFMHI